MVPVSRLRISTDVEQTKIMVLVHIFHRFISGTTNGNSSEASEFFD